MDITLVRGSNQNLVVGGTWDIEFFTAEDGYLEAANAVVTVTLPDDSVLTAEQEYVTTPGVCLVRFPVTQPGRYTAELSADDSGSKFLVAYALEITEDGYPTAAEVVSYLKNTTRTAEEVQPVLDAEAAAQRERCTIPAAYPADLRLALMRRVAVALAKEGVLYDGEAANELGFTPTPRQHDSEVLRLENPYRKVVLGL